MSTLGRRSLPRRTLAVLATVLLLALAAGAWAGLHAPWGTKHPLVKRGVALRANNENGLVMFDADDGTQLTLDAGNLWWESNSTGGEGDPPCLKTPGRKSQVEVGYLQVAGPDGGSRPVPQWLTCLDE